MGKSKNKLLKEIKVCICWINIYFKGVSKYNYFYILSIKLDEGKTNERIDF